MVTHENETGISVWHFLYSSFYVKSNTTIIPLISLMLKDACEAVARSLITSKQYFLC